MTLTERELELWGERIGAATATPLFLMLRGPLGAGKSVLARSVARGAGVEDSLPSPTFNLVFRYASPSGRNVVHLDLYRLTHEDELWELGWEELGRAGEIVIVEWPERAGSLLPRNRWEVALLSPTPGSTVREVSVERVGHPPELPGYPVELSAR